MPAYSWPVEYQGEQLIGREVACESGIGPNGPRHWPTVQVDDGRMFRAAYRWAGMGDERYWIEVDPAVVKEGCL